MRSATTAIVGSKGGAGVAQRIVSLMPPHELYIEAFAQTRGGTSAIETVWCNFPEPAELHDTRFVGDGFRDRERIRRKISRWVRRLERLPLAERAVILAAFDDAGLPRQKWRCPRQVLETRPSSAWTLACHLQT
jgi:hypothetical protein